MRSQTVPRPILQELEMQKVYGDGGRKGFVPMEALGPADNFVFQCGT